MIGSVDALNRSIPPCEAGLLLCLRGRKGNTRRPMSRMRHACIGKRLLLGLLECLCYDRGWATTERQLDAVPSAAMLGPPAVRQRRILVTVIATFGWAGRHLSYRSLPPVRSPMPNTLYLPAKGRGAASAGSGAVSNRKPESRQVARSTLSICPSAMGAWPRIAALYNQLHIAMPSPVVELNRAIAHGMAFGPEPALRLVDEIAEEGVLRDHPPLHAARGDLLFRMGRRTEARSAFATAAKLTLNTRERTFLLAREDECIRDERTSGIGESIIGAE